LATNSECFMLASLMHGAAANFVHENLPYLQIIRGRLCTQYGNAKRHFPSKLTQFHAYSHLKKVNKNLK
jgi:hypothetical protein